MIRKFLAASLLLISIVFFVLAVGINIPQISFMTFVIISLIVCGFILGYNNFFFSGITLISSGILLQLEMIFDNFINNMFFVIAIFFFACSFYLIFGRLNKYRKIGTENVFTNDSNNDITLKTFNKDSLIRNWTSNLTIRISEDLIIEETKKMYIDNYFGKVKIYAKKEQIKKLNDRSSFSFFNSGIKKNKKINKSGIELDIKTLFGKVEVIEIPVKDDKEYSQEVNEEDTGNVSV